MQFAAARRAPEVLRGNPYEGLPLTGREPSDNPEWQFAVVAAVEPVPRRNPGGVTHLRLEAALLNDASNPSIILANATLTLMFLNGTSDDRSAGTTAPHAEEIDFLGSGARIAATRYWFFAALPR